MPYGQQGAYSAIREERDSGDEVTIKFLFQQLLDSARTDTVIFCLRMMDDDCRSGLFGDELIGGTQRHAEFLLIEALLLNRLLKKYLINILTQIGLIELIQYHLRIFAAKIIPPPAPAAKLGMINGILYQSVPATRNKLKRRSCRPH
jgi:hypothetical protein